LADVGAILKVNRPRPCPSYSGAADMSVCNTVPSSNTSSTSSSRTDSPRAARWTGNWSVGISTPSRHTRKCDGAAPAGAVFDKFGFGVRSWKWAAAFPVIVRHGKFKGVRSI